MLTQKARYALRALVVLAETEEPSLPISRVAQLSRAPHKFLEAILLELRRAGLLRSIRGKSGGYALALPSSEISLGQVIRLIDGPLALTRCASETAYSPCEDCADPETCRLRKVMRRVRDATAAILDTTPLDSLRGRPDSEIGGLGEGGAVISGKAGT